MTEPSATLEMCSYCYDAIISKFSNRDLPVPAAFDATIECPFFVTLKKDEALRGCIGSLSPKCLALLADFALSSAFKDRRFRPLAEAELPQLDLSVSLLVNYERGLRYDDWIVGTHGIIIEFTIGGTSYAATYLPEVAPEQNWDQHAAVLSLIQKAGFNGKVDNAVLESISLTRYQSSKIALSYVEYVRIKGI